MPKFLFKANDDVLSHCTCDWEPAMSTGQLDCPWCGCGWLISCSRCKRSYTFAVVRETDVSLFELGRREAAARGLGPVAADDIQMWADAMSEALDVFQPGDIVVYLDGSYWSLDATSIAFDGYFASHTLERLPHAEALTDRPRLRAVLGDRSYWLDRERPDRE
jgi:hypothetical protein